MTGNGSARLFRFLGVLIVFLASVLLSFHAASAETFDWRDVNGQNWLSPVRNQFGGTCWDFAACGVIESKYMLTRNDSAYRPNVSEQQINWETNPDMGSTDGGQAYKVMDYFTNHGVVLDSECPYQSSSPDTGVAPYWPLASGWQNRVFKSTSNLNRLAEDTNVAHIKNCLKKYGPLTLRMTADTDFYIPDPGEDRGGHVVVIVGFHDDASVPGGGYWIIRNSWGSGWNSNGPGTIQDGYGAITYDARPSFRGVTYEWWDIFKVDPQYNRDVCGLNGPVVFTGPMASVTWKGGSGTWSSGGNHWSGTDMYGASLTAYAWQNRETWATFNASTGTDVALSGTVIAHGLTISAGATGYVFNGVNGGALTVTSGGITANETAAINAPVTIGAPQTWTVASGKRLTIDGDLHTIISNLTITGSADTVVTGSIDGGGALNAMGAAPGKIILTSGAYLWLNGAASYSVDIDAQSGSHGICFSQPEGVVGNAYGKISGGGWIDKRDRGTIILHNSANNYTNWTSIYDGGAVQADSGAGLPTASFVNLNGGVLQSNGTTTFTRSLGTTGSGKFQWNTSGGGFAGGAGPMTVRVNNGTSTLTWGTTKGTHIVGTLKFGSTTAANTVTFENGIDLNAAQRTIHVEDNPNSGGDIAIVSGVLTDLQAFSSNLWTGALRKTGPGTLILTGGAAGQRNEYGDGLGHAGSTTIADGAMQADRDKGLSGWSGLILDGGVLQSNSAITYAEPLWGFGGETSRRVIWKSGGFSAGGGKMTVNIGGNSTPQTINFGGSDGKQAIAGVLKLSSNSARYETELRNGLNLNGGARTVQVDDNPFESGDFATVSGVISGAGSLTKTGSGILYLSGSSGNTYTGATTITAGRLRLNKTSGVAIAGDLNLIGNGVENNYVYLERSNQIAPSAIVTFANDPAYSSRLNLLGNSQTVGGISCSDGRGVIQNTENESGISTNGVLTLNTVSDYSYNGYLRDRYQSGSTGKVALVKTGAAAQTLSGANIRYTGGTTINGGRLLLEDTTNSSFLAAGITNNATLEFSTVATDVSHAGVIGGTGSLVKSGSYALTLGGSAGNTYAGSTTVTAGSLYLNKSSGAAISGNLDIVGTGSNVYVQLSRDEQIANASVVSLSNTANYARFYLNGYTETVGGIACADGRGIIQSGNLIVAGAGSHSYNGYLRDSGGVNLSLAKQGAGAQTLSGANISYTGGTTIAGGRLVLENTTNAGFLASSITNNAALEFHAANAAVNFTGTIGGTGSLTKSGAQTLTLGGATGNTYAGTTTVSAGSLYLNKSSGLAIPGNLNIAGAGTDIYVYLSRDEQIGDSSVVSLSNTANYVRLGLNGYTETVGGINCADGRGVVQSGNLIVGGSGSYSYNGYLRNFGGVNATLEKKGTGTQTLSGSNITYTGGTTINGGKLVLRDTTNSSFRAAAVTNNATLEFDTATTDINFIGTISGTGAVRKVGSNRLTLGSAINSYSGTTTIVDGVLSASSTAVPGAMVIQSGGAFAPGDVVGSATTGATTWSGGRYLFDIADADGIAGIDWDLWNIEGSMWISGSSTLAVTTLSGEVAGEMADFDNTTPYSWLLAETTGNTYGFFNLGLDASGFQNELDPAGYLHLSAVGNFKQLYLNYSLSMPGDANRDNRVDEIDARLLAASWGKSGGWLDGDFNGDGIVNALDASILAANWGYQAESSASHQSVPEPCVLALLALGLLSLLARRRARWR